MAANENIAINGPHDLVTEEHIQKTLKVDKGIAAQLIEWEIKDFTKKGDNMATFVTSVDVSYAVKEQIKRVSYVVKLNPCRNIKDLESATVDIFKKETKFYQDLAPVLNSILESDGQPLLRIPKCLYFSTEVGKEVIFMEDLRPRGFKMTETGLAGMDFSHTIVLMKELARFHAASWVLQKKRPGEDLQEKYDFLNISFVDESSPGTQYFNNMMARGIAITITMLEHIGGYDKVIDWIKQHKSSSPDIMLNMLKRSPPFDVVCHGDMHVNNTLFRYNDKGEPIEVMLLDHQINRVASLSTDLNYLLFISLAGVVRQPNLKTFLQTYFDSFSQVVENSGEKVSFSFQEFLQEFQNKHHFGLIFAMFVSPLLVVTAVDFPDAEEFLGNINEETTEEQKAKLLKSLDTNHALRKKFLDVFDEMRKVGIFD